MILPATVFATTMVTTFVTTLAGTSSPADPNPVGAPR
jgi:hypothetical protein